MISRHSEGILNTRSSTSTTMPHAQLPGEAFRRVFPRKGNTRTTFPQGGSKYDTPCRYGQSCRFLEVGECCYYHKPGSLPLSELMVDDLSDPITLPAFGPVDTTFQRYGIRNVETLASFNVLKDGRLAVPGMSFVVPLTSWQRTYRPRPPPSAPSPGIGYLLSQARPLFPPPTPC